MVYDAVSYSAILDAHERTHGIRSMPHYLFDQAEVIIGVEADFLGTWISPVEFTKGYIKGRTLEGETPKLSYHAQFEGRMSLTGSNADQRVRITPGEAATILKMLADRLADRSGTSIPQTDSISGSSSVNSDTLDAIADRLWESRGNSLVVCGINDVGTQCLVNAINQLLGNYNQTLDLARPSYQWQSNDVEIQNLLEAMRAGNVNALVIAGANPVYSLPNGQAFGEAMAQVPLTIAVSDYLDETATAARYVCPAHHALETWSDAEPVAGTISVSQPAIRPMTQTRSIRECLAAWTSGTFQDDRTLMLAYWEQNMYPRRESDMPFQNFWDQAVHDGYISARPPRSPSGTYRQNAEWPTPVTVSSSSDRFALVMYEKIGLRDGRHAYNPWLQELPDPITKRCGTTTWPWRRLQRND